MALRFPSKPDIRLRRSPLNEVICQVRFPPILKIASEPPAEFQDAVRERFPLFELEQGLTLRMPDSEKSEQGMLEFSSKIYRFKTPEGKANAGLSTDFFAIGASQYAHWNDFKRDISLVRDATQRAYHPSYATRIGLRFINRFTLENTGSSTKDELLGLFRPQMTCLVETNAWDEPQDLAMQMLLNDDSGKLSIRSLFSHENGRPIFVLDFDYFEEGQLAFDSIIERLDRFHQRIYDAFRWSIDDESLERFEPLNEEGGK